jgi:hypothetical protein
VIEQQPPLRAGALRQKHSGCHSFSGFVREAALRMLYDRDLRSLFTRVQELIDDLTEIKERYMNPLLELSDKPFEE